MVNNEIPEWTPVPPSEHLVTPEWEVAVATYLAGAEMRGDLAILYKPTEVPAEANVLLFGQETDAVAAGAPGIPRVLPGLIHMATGTYDIPSIVPPAFNLILNAETDEEAIALGKGARVKYTSYDIPENVLGVLVQGLKAIGF